MFSPPPPVEKFFMPPEWSPHAACWMGFPCRAEAFGDEADMQNTRLTFAAIARCISQFEKVNMLVRPQDVTVARDLLAGVATIIEMPLDDSWLRDSGPSFVKNAAGEVGGVSWQFNAWGNKYSPYNKDDEVAVNVLNHLNMRCFAAPLIMEGGSFSVDGEGTLLTTEQCLLHTNRNPQLSQSQIEQLLKEYLGVRKVIWLAGDKRDTETDGHIDEVACFIAPGVVLAMTEAGDDMLEENISRLRATKDANGRQLQVITLPRPQVYENGEYLLASYINFYFANGGIVMPSFGVEEDAHAKNVFVQTFPNHKIVQTDALAVVRGGGGIHCITQQQPI